MPSNGTQVIGTKMAFSAGIPATYDLAGMAAKTYTPSTEVISVGDVGAETEVIKYTTVHDGKTHKRMGATDAGSQGIMLSFDSDNAAQAILETASNNRTPVCVSEELPTAANNDDGDVLYYVAYVQRAKVAAGGSSDTVRYDVVLEVDGEVYIDKATLTV